MIKSVVVLGGGTAGWLTASLIAAKHHDKNSPFQVTLIESPNIATIGVGEGTWPTMVNTLQQLGIGEMTFMQRCDASFKQASKFVNWYCNKPNDAYYHPFTPPASFEQVSLVDSWQQSQSQQTFADAVSIQATLCDENRAPKQLKLGDYSTIENYGYHLDAGKFAQLLTEHGTHQLNINRVLDEVTAVQSHENGDISALKTKESGTIYGDLFIDCSGQAAVLIGQHYQVPFICKKDVLFIDKAIAAQVPYPDNNAPVASATLSTAQQAGWIWDIGLPTRRGVGHVFSSKYTSEQQAKADLISYLNLTNEQAEQFRFKSLDINPGYRATFWHKNCVAVGMASGFLEPLEASAIVMVELAAKTIALQMPADRSVMDIVAKQYNKNMTFRWQRIIDFLKLHYVLSKRDDSDFWKDNRAEASVPKSLQELLQLWQFQPPQNNGFLSPYDLFPAASYQYILYGMGFNTQKNYLANTEQQKLAAKKALNVVTRRKSKVPPLLPTNREILNEIRQLATNGCIDVTQSSSRYWQYVPKANIEQVSQSYPVFFKKHTNGYSCITLLSLTDKTLMQNKENRGQLEDYFCTPLATEDEYQFIPAELLEPAKLDITLIDNSTVCVTGLYVIKQTQWQQQSIKAQFNSMHQKLIENLIASLAHIPRLIEQENLMRET